MNNHKEAIGTMYTNFMMFTYGNLRKVREHKPAILRHGDYLNYFRSRWITDRDHIQVINYDTAVSLKNVSPRVAEYLEAQKYVVEIFHHKLGYNSSESFPRAVAKELEEPMAFLEQITFDEFEKRAMIQHPNSEMWKCFVVFSFNALRAFREQNKVHRFLPYEKLREEFT